MPKATPTLGAIDSTPTVTSCSSSVSALASPSSVPPHAVRSSADAAIAAMPGKNFLVMGSPGPVIIERAGEFQNAGTSVLPCFDRTIHQLRYTIDYLSLQWKTPSTTSVICITNAAGQLKRTCGHQKLGVPRT